MTRVHLTPGAQAWFHRDNAAQTIPGHGKATPATIHKLQNLAAEHERHRMDTVAETLTLVGFLRQRKVLNGFEQIQVTGAKYQWVGGSRAQGTQGAHCIPGWLSFNSTALHEMTGWTPENLKACGLKPNPLSVKLRNLGGRVDLMATVINTTDSALERMGGDRGLKPALRIATYNLMLKLNKSRTDDPMVVEDVVREVMNEYRHRASEACEERLDYYADAHQRAVSAQDFENMKQRALTTESYLGVVQDAAVLPFTTTPSTFTAVLKDVIGTS